MSGKNKTNPVRGPARFPDQMQKTLIGALDTSSELVMITNREGAIEFVNPVFEQVTGYSEQEVVGRTSTILRSVFHKSSFYTELWKTICSGQTFRDIFINRKKDGSFYEELKTISPVLDDWGSISHFVSCGRVLSEQVEFDQRFKLVGGFDELTGLPDRIAMTRMLEQSLDRLDKLGQKALMVYVDLDNFSSVNAGIGYPTGDQILLEFATRMQSSILPGDLVARVGADEFGLLIAGRGGNTSEADIMLAALRDRLERPFSVDGRQYYLTCSVGAAFFPSQGRDGETLFKRSEIALREAKAQGGSQVAYYTTNREQHDDRTLSLVSKLFTALEDEQFELHYQPQVTLSNAAICGVEALLRWRPRNGQCKAPDFFIPALESSSLIIPVGRWILRAACEVVASWEQQGIEPVRLAVNLSAIQFRDQELLSTVNNAIRDTGIKPEMLELEITESVVMTQSWRMNRVLEGFRDLGVRVCIDDFGTGYSNLRYLAEMPLDTIKIAREFVCEIGKRSASEEVIKTIVNLAHNLGLSLVAEGVETIEQRDFLNSIGCEYAQGYLYSKAVIESEALALLQENGSSALSA